MVALQGNRTSGLPEIIELVQTLSEKALEISVQELAQVVEKDTAVLARILTIANAFGYNPSGLPINTVSGAIQVIGFERIRTLAISLLLVEQSNRQQTVAERREAATFALFSGCLAKAMAERGMGVDAEEAFVCASLRHFGRIVLSTFMTDEYREALQLTAEMPEDESFKQIFGMTPLELSYELLRAEHLPAEILAALKTFHPEKVTSAEKPEVRCHALADFSSQMSLLVFNPEIGQEEFERRTQAISQRYTRVFPSLVKEFNAVLGSTESQLTHFYQGVGANILPRECLSRLQHRIAKIDPLKPLRAATRGKEQAMPTGDTPKSTPAGAVKSEAEDSATKGASQSAKEAAHLADGGGKEATARRVPADVGAGKGGEKNAQSPAAENAAVVKGRGDAGISDGAENAGTAAGGETIGAFEAALAVWERKAAERTTPEASVQLGMLRLLQRVLGADECVLFLADAQAETPLRVVQGLGELWDTWGERAIVRPGERTALGLCLSRRENILIHDARDRTLEQHLPVWLRTERGLGAYVLIPLRDRLRRQGLALVGWREPRKIEMTATCIEVIHRIHRALPRQ